MRKRQREFFCGIRILFIMVFALCGCSAMRLSKKTGEAKESYVPNLTPKLREDVVRFIDLKELDLDNDGKKEIVAIYNAGLNLRGVKVIKDNVPADKNVIFAKVFNTNDLRFELRNGLPMLIAKDNNSAGCGLTKFYVWDGKGFIHTI